MDISIEYSQVESKNDAYLAVKSAITPELLARFQVKATIDYFDDYIMAKGKGFKLKMEFNTSSCDVYLDLAFLLKPLRAKITDAIEKQIKRVV
ncbi:MAG: hypothetical protein HON90_13945 [Halobacteriovoraceae bacterium]|jgi:hypothetical protein|nr:hypothetical protein [Halobacteriovoraceae bacterium]